MGGVSTAASDPIVDSAEGQHRGGVVCEHRDLAGVDRSLGHGARRLGNRAAIGTMRVTEQRDAHGPPVRAESSSTFLSTESLRGRISVVSRASFLERT